MRKLSAVVIALVCLIGCFSGDRRVTYEYPPSEEVGCNEYAGAAFWKCVQAALDTKQQREDSGVTREVLETERISDEYVRTTYRVCRHDLCHIEHHDEPDQVWYKALGYEMLKIVGAVGVGVLIGALL